MRVLIAEDDPVTARLLSELLASWTFDLVAVRDGLEALAAFERDPLVQLVLLDWELPGMDGPDVCRRVRAMRGDRPTHIILLTSRAARSDVVAGLEAGADDYLVKPFDPGELRARLHAGVRILDLQQRLALKVQELEHALAEVRTLGGLLPICAYCKAIRDDSNYWHQVERYMEEHADVRFTHGICPACYEGIIEKMDRM